MLVHPKDKVDPFNCTDCIYEIPCMNCDHSYIGETARLKEHRKETLKLESSKKNCTHQSRKQSVGKQSKLAIADHAVQCNHVIDHVNAKVLEKEDNMELRHIRESIWIRKKGATVMNRDERAHYLSHVFDPLLVTSSADHQKNRKSDGQDKDGSL